MPIERKLAAIMFTDIAGYTALSAKDENKALALLDTQKQILTPIIEEFNGTLHKEVGDGLLFTFPTVTEAVKCGIKIQEKTKANDDLNLRVGIHEGEITLKDGDALGDDVNVASRIEAFAPSGGIAISSKIQQNISSLPEFETSYVGKPELKGVAQEVKVYCITSHGLPKSDEITESSITENKSNFNIYAIMGGILTAIGIAFWIAIGVFDVTSYGENDTIKNETIIENVYISLVRSSIEDLEALGDTVLINDLNHTLSPISNDKIENLNESILSQTIPALDKEFNYKSHYDLIDEMAKDGKLPIDFDYRSQKMDKKEKDTGTDVFPLTYIGSTNQFQIESDIHIAILLNIYNIDPPVNNVKKYFTLIKCEILYADIIDLDNKNLNNLRKHYNNKDINYLRIIKTDLNDIGMLKHAHSTKSFFSSSLDEIPIQLSHEINKLLLTTINSGYIFYYNPFEANITAISDDFIIIKHNDKKNRLKKNMHLSVSRGYHSDENGKEIFLADLNNYKKIIQGNDSLITIFNESSNSKAYTQTALNVIAEGHHCLSYQHCSFNRDIDIEIKIIDVFDETAKGIIVKENKNPYINIKLGDKLYFN